MSNGRRLTDHEYEEAIAKLYSDASPMPSKAEDCDIRQKELSLMIDHRLGVDFPDDLRKALWLVQQDIEKRRLRLVALHLLDRLALRNKTDGTTALAAYLVDQYASVIGREAAERLFDLKPEEKPTNRANSG